MYKPHYDMWWLLRKDRTMKRFYYILLALSCLTLSANAQTHMLQYGVRGGMAFGVGSVASEARTSLGGIGATDIGYTYYTPVSSMDMGVHTGLSFGYRQMAMGHALHEQFTNTDYLGNDMHYTIMGNVALRQRDVFCEVPVMFALRSDGLVFNAGAKLCPSLWQQNMQELSHVSIDAYYPLTDVHVTNELITGLLPEEQYRQVKSASMASFSLSAGFELGYEWEVSRTNTVGFQLFMDCTLWQTGTRAGEQPVILVAPVANAQNPVPKVSVNNTTASQLGLLHPIECGIKLYGTLFKREHRHWHRKWQ